LSHLYVSISGAGDEELFAWVYGKASDGRVVGLEAVPKLPLPHIQDADIAFLPGGYENLVLRRVHYARRSLLVASEHWTKQKGQKPREAIR